MKTFILKGKRGFTLMETVIAIGVLAVLLTAFMAVFGPATRGIRKAINIQDADRLVGALESKCATDEVDGSSTNPAFNRAYDWIEKSGNKGTGVVFLYQYKGDPNGKARGDGSMPPYKQPGGSPGKEFIVQAAVRKADDSNMIGENGDLKALQGRIYFVKMTQLVPDPNGNGLIKGKLGQIQNPTGNNVQPALTGSGADSYNDAYITFVADFYEIQTTSEDFLKSKLDPDKYGTPIFSRNLVIRR
jgi:prepilin-type N-terminal cleavage/methylation domain-containing protein